MKITITYKEVQYFELEKEVEMTSSEYKAFIKMSQSEQERKYDLCSSTGDECHVITEVLSIDTKINN